MEEEIMNSHDDQLLHTFEASHHVVQLLANFSHDYVAYLLPSLLNLRGAGSRRGSKSMEYFEKLVRFQVDMALALSASGFAWSRALKQKLEQGACSTKEEKPLYSIRAPTKQVLVQKNIAVVFAELWTSPFVARPLPPTMAEKPRRARKPRGYRTRTLMGSGSKQLLRDDEEELRHCMRSLRSVVPGGSEMGVRELLSEVESYVICLELQPSLHGSSSGAPAAPSSAFFGDSLNKVSPSSSHGRISTAGTTFKVVAAGDLDEGKQTEQDR